MSTSIRFRPVFLIASLACLTSVLPPARAQMPPQDLGATGAWQKLLKLRTTASAMHTTAHPDDEHGGVLAMLSRGQGARVSLLTLTRGESGDNAIGPELFDGLGLIRTEELLVANRYYGVDRQYFGTVVDYGFSKRLDEALEKWGTRTRPPRRRRHHPHRAAVRAHREISGKHAGRPRQPLGGGADHAGSVQGGGRPDGVPGADRRGASTVAAVEAVHGRRARERGLDDPCGCRRVRPGARGLVSVVRAPRPELPAVAEQRALQRAAGSGRVVLQASSVGG